MIYDFSLRNVRPFFDGDIWRYNPDRISKNGILQNKDIYKRRLRDFEAAFRIITYLLTGGGMILDKEMEEFFNHQSREKSISHVKLKFSCDEVDELNVFSYGFDIIDGSILNEFLLIHKDEEDNFGDNVFIRNGNDLSLITEDGNIYNLILRGETIIALQKVSVYHHLIINLEGPSKNYGLTRKAKDALLNLEW